MSETAPEPKFATNWSYFVKYNNVGMRLEGSQSSNDINIDIEKAVDLPFDYHWECWQNKIIKEDDLFVSGYTCTYLDVVAKNKMTSTIKAKCVSNKENNDTQQITLNEDNVKMSVSLIVSCRTERVN